MKKQKRSKETSREENSWATIIPDDQWEVYRGVIREMQREGVPFALGGAFSVATYTGQWRNTKDLDFYVLPEDREKAIAVVTNLGMQDYYEKLPYQRHWIYRSYKDDFIVDLIWEMANDWDRVDRDWLTRGPEISIRQEELRIIPAEELIWAKLYVLQKDRCDWPDILNLLYTTGPELNWDHLFERMAQDLPLLRGILSVFAWLSPGRAQDLPDDLWERVQLPAPVLPPDPEGTMRRRTDRLDTRPWFIPVLEEGQAPFSVI